MLCLGAARLCSVFMWSSDWVTLGLTWREATSRAQVNSRPQASREPLLSPDWLGVCLWLCGLVFQWQSVCWVHILMLCWLVTEMIQTQVFEVLKNAFKYLYISSSSLKWSRVGWPAFRNVGFPVFLWVCLSFAYLVHGHEDTHAHRWHNAHSY